MKNKILLIIGLLLPPIGIILYFIFKKKDKSKSSNSIKGSVVGFCIYGIILLYISTHSIDYFNRTVDAWYKDVKAGNTVLTVIGASYCGHCQSYKPVISKIAKENNINLYFYEIDTLSENDQNKLTNSFPLEEYDGSVPYTFIMKDGQFINHTIGYQYESVTTNFLWENGLIKD